MQAPNDNTAPRGLRAWWTSPPRSGMRLIIAPWEYRHLRGFASMRITGAVVLAGLALVTLAFGGTDATTYAWATAFAAAGAAHLAFRPVGAEHRSLGGGPSLTPLGDSPLLEYPQPAITTHSQPLTRPSRTVGGTSSC